MNDRRELDVAIEALCLAARVCAAVQVEDAANRVDKADRSPVTVADLASQAVVAAVLQREFPNDPLIAEETTAELERQDGTQLAQRVTHYVRRVFPEASTTDVLDWIRRGTTRTTDSSRTWTLDPIDGTKGFLRGQQYAIALALLVDGQVTAGVLACPNLPPSGIEPTEPGHGVLLGATRGNTSFMAPLDNPQARTTVSVSSRCDGATLRICESVEAAHTAHGLAARVSQALGIQTSSLRVDSQAKYALVARGDAELYLRLPTRAEYREKIWDHAAGCLVLEQAGGRVTDIDGKPLDFRCGPRLERNRGIVATNGCVHDRVLEAIRRELARRSS